MPLAEVDTPALLLDLDAFERNLDTLNRTLRSTPVRVRPHAKSHKCAQIALAQIARGAVGVCCQKVSEAEALVQGGVRDVLIANEVVGAPKLTRLAELARQARMGVCVDDLHNVDDLLQAASRTGARLDVYVEVDVGAGRCGVAPGEPALRLAQAIARASSLRLGGLHAYQGAAQHRRTPQERRSAIAEAVGKVRATVELLKANGIEVPIVTGAGTGTYLLEAGRGIYN
jgi:3-hydroxy-D-aspartate aldolase